MEITSTMIGVATGDGTMPALLARPQAPGKHPAVIVVMEAFGLNEHIKDVARRIAAEGYVTIAPDVYYRKPHDVVAYDDLPEAIRLMGTLTNEGVVADVDAITRHLATREFVQAERIGITGFCMGGRISFLAACRCAGLKAAVPFYGGGIGGHLGEAASLRCPVLLFFGDRDDFIPDDEVENIRTTLAGLGKEAEVKVYAGAGHGFFCDERPSYDPDAAEDAWRRLLDFLAAHLRG